MKERGVLTLTTTHQVSALYLSVHIDFSSTSCLHSFMTSPRHNRKDLLNLFDRITKMPQQKQPRSTPGHGNKCTRPSKDSRSSTVCSESSRTMTTRSVTPQPFTPSPNLHTTDHAFGDKSQTPTHTEPQGRAHLELCTHFLGYDTVPADLPALISSVQRRVAMLSATHEDWAVALETLKTVSIEDLGVFTNGGYLY